MAEWIGIEGYESFYEVSDLGQIRSLDKTIIYQNGRTQFMAGKIMKRQINKRNGYCYIGFRKDGIQKGFRIHILVAKAFIPNPLNLPQVNHKDYDKRNNNVLNLEWSTGSMNQQHAQLKPGRKFQRHRLGKNGAQSPKSKPVTVFNLKGELIGHFESQCIAAGALGCDQVKISLCCNGIRKSHKKLKFKFTNNEK